MVMKKSMLILAGIACMLIASVLSIQHYDEPVVDEMALKNAAAIANPDDPIVGCWGPGQCTILPEEEMQTRYLSEFTK